MSDAENVGGEVEYERRVQNAGDKPNEELSQREKLPGEAATVELQQQSNATRTQMRQWSNSVHDERRATKSIRRTKIPRRSKTVTRITETAEQQSHGDQNRHARCTMAAKKVMSSTQRSLELWATAKGARDDHASCEPQQSNKVTTITHDKVYNGGKRSTRRSHTTRCMPAAKGAPGSSTQAT